MVFDRWGFQPISGKAFEVLQRARLRPRVNWRKIRKEDVTHPGLWNRSAGIHTLRYGWLFNEYTSAMERLIARTPPRPGQTVVELGCGPGASVLMGRRLLPKVRFFGVDAAPQMLRQAKLLQQRAGALGVKFNGVKRDGTTRFSSGGVDQVWVHNAAHEEGVLKEASRIVRPGGVIKIVHGGTPLRIFSEESAQNWVHEIQDFLPGFALKVSKRRVGKYYELYIEARKAVQKVVHHYIGGPNKI